MPELPIPMAENIKESFKVLDFILFFGVVALSLGVGSFFAFRDRKKNSTDNYYFGERQISPVAVAISISVSFVSAVNMIGVPADVYLHGNAYAWTPVSILLADIIAVVYHVPLFYKLKILSVFEYLEMRFHRSVRMLVSGLRLMSYALYLAVATFLPALALHTVTPLDLRWTIALTSMICTIYTTLGGMKAVIWTDVMQAIVMIVGMVVTYIVMVQSLGSMDAVSESVARGGRVTMLKFDIDPRVKYTAWSMFFGQFINSYYILICNQVSVQRWLSCRKIRSARIATATSIVPLALMNIFTVLIGLAVYAFYEGCDPLLMKRITKPDQIIPYTIVKLFSDIPGMVGLMVSAAFSGNLSTVSSGINAAAAMILSDFVVIWFPRIKEDRKVLLSKIITFSFGTLVMILAYGVSFTSTTILSVGVSVTGLFAGPITAIFMMGVFMPWINYKSVLIGCTIGFLFLCWIQISVLVLPVDTTRWEPLHLSTDNCTFPQQGNWTLPINSTAYPRSSSDNRTISALGKSLFAISPYLYGIFGTIACIIMTHIASLFIGFEKPSDRIKRLAVPLCNWPGIYPRCMRLHFDFNKNRTETCEDLAENDMHITDVPKLS